MLSYKSFRTKIFATKEQKEILSNGIELHRRMYNTLVEYINPLVNEGLMCISTKTSRNDELEEFLFDCFEEQIIANGISIRTIRGVVRNYIDAWSNYNNEDMPNHKQPNIHPFSDYKQSMNFVDLKPSIEINSKQQFFINVPRWKRSTKIKEKNLKTKQQFAMRIKELPEQRFLKKLNNPVAKEYCIQRIGSEFYLIVVYEHTVINTTINLKNSDIQAIGIDWGLVDYYIDSNGQRYNLPKRYFRQKQKIKRLQQILARKTKGSKNYQKMVNKLRKAYLKTSNIKKQWREETTKKFCRENDYIFAEDLDVMGMRNKVHKSRRRNINTNNPSDFMRRLKQKAPMYNCKVIKIDQYFPSSQLCSSCGENTGKKPVSIREFVCPYCGAKQDRDINAAINILKEGLRMLSDDQAV